MQGTIYLHLLILCGIWYQGIIGTFADEEMNESSDYLVRQKRVVSYEQGGANVVRIEERPYIVYIKRSGRFICIGTILSYRVVITIAECAEFPETQYKIAMKTSTTSFTGMLHNVTNIKVLKGNIPHRNYDGIALFTIDPTIVFGLFIKKIDLSVEPLLPGMVGTVSGWGYNNRTHASGPGTNYPRSLRTIEVPIISHRDCVGRYQHLYPITDKDICTFHPQRHSGHTDGGAPLVIDNLLVGIFLRSGPLGYRYNPEYPEIFALLQHTDYSNWIRANI